MGLLDSIFGGGSSSMSGSQRALVDEERKLSEEEQLKADELAREEEEARLGLKSRGQGMQGGGREGLMFGRSQQGVA